MGKQASFFDYLIRACKKKRESSYYKEFSSFLLDHVPEDERAMFDPARAKALICCEVYCHYVDALFTLGREYDKESA